MRARALASSTLIVMFSLLGALAAAHPSWAGTPNGSGLSIPTLDGAGLATLGGAVAMAGAWLVSRKRNRD